MRIPGQMVRMTFLAPTAGAITGVRPPLVAPAVPAFIRFAILSCNGPFGFFDQGRSPRVVGCWLEAESGLPYRLLHIQCSGRGEPAIEVVLLRHEVVVQCRQVKRPEFLAPTVVKLSR